MLEVYLVTNKINRKQYVGITTRGTTQRWAVHLKDARGGSKYHLHCAIRLYGVEHFTIQQLQLCQTLAELYAAEVAWIEKLGTFVNGYNSTVGGDGVCGYRMSAERRQRHPENVRRAMACEEVKQRQAAAAKAAWNAPEKRCRMLKARENPEAKDRKSAAIKIALAHPEVKATKILAAKALWLQPTYRAAHVGKKHSAETINKMCEAQRARWALRKNAKANNV